MIVDPLAFEQAVLASKSFIIALALTERHINVQQAVEASQVEVLSQIKQWGMVEDGKFLLDGAYKIGVACLLCIDRLTLHH